MRSVRFFDGEGSYVVRVGSTASRHGYSGESWIVEVLVLTSNNLEHPAGSWRAIFYRVGPHRIVAPPCVVIGAVLGLRTKMKPTTTGRDFTVHDWLSTCPVHTECMETIEMGCACLEATRGQHHV